MPNLKDFWAKYFTADDAIGLKIAKPFDNGCWVCIFYRGVAMGIVLIVSVYILIKTFLSFFF